MRRTSALLARFVTLLLPIPSFLGAQVPEAPVRYDQDYLSPDFHRSRRAEVMERLPESAVAVFFGAPTRNRSNDVDYEYRQDSDFLYLTGSDEIGSALVLVPAGVTVDGVLAHEVLFVPTRDPAAEVWTGRRFGNARAVQQLGLERAVEAARFEEIVGPLLSDGARSVFTLALPDGVPAGSDLASQLAVMRSFEGRTDRTLLRAVLTDARTIKAEEEVELLGRAINITAEAHREVMTAVEPGWAEYEIEALVEYVFKRRGAQYPGFPSIVGSGENSTILHYETNRRVTEPGDLIVIDIGAEVHGYSADVTRTLPVSGSFSPEQRAIYELVYRAQEAGIAEARAGTSFRAGGQAASAVLASGLAELGLIAGPGDMRGLRRFFMHGTSHYLGLDVHDVGDYGTLEPGTVITVEPGLYIPAADDIDPKWWNIGVRIEDDVLITFGDPVVLSAEAPRTADAVEALMRRRPVGQ